MHGDVQTVLFQSFREGDLGPCYNKYSTSLSLFVRSKGAGEQDAKEIVAESFTSLWLNRDKMGSLSDIRDFLYNSARNHTLSVFRKHIWYRTALAKLEKEPSDPEWMHIEALRYEILVAVYQCHYVKQLPKKEMKPVKTSVLAAYRAKVIAMFRKRYKV